MRKKRLSVSEIKDLLNARTKMELAGSEAFKERLVKAGIETASQAEKDPQAEELQNRVLDHINEVIAHQLRRNKTSSLLSKRDLTKISDNLSSELVRTLHADEPPEQQEQRKTFYSNFLKKLFGEVKRITYGQKNAHAEYWRWINMVYQVAEEYLVPALDLLVLQDGRDEVTRRLHSRNQFVALSKRVLKPFLDIKFIRRAMLEPLFNGLVASEKDLTKEEEKELRETLENELVPEIEKRLTKIRPIVDEYVHDQVVRIYGV